MADTIQKRKIGISGSTLKMIAVITMLIDHVGAGVLGRYLTMYSWNATLGADVYDTLWIIYNVMRGIGRIAFPIYCFLLVEGFTHTKSVGRYSLRLLVFAFVSEVPFDLLFCGKTVDLSYQNVFFTLWIGLLVMWGYKWIEERQKLHVVAKVLLDVIILLAGMAFADFLATDYSYYGVFAITMLYIFREKKVAQIVAGCLSFLWEIWAPVAFIPIGFYNGKRGWNMKYFFYCFYPVHLLLLYLLCVLLGISGYVC
ncbi:MAG: TraX family protein [Roseburia sp.]